MTSMGKSRTVPDATIKARPRPGFSSKKLRDSPQLRCSSRFSSVFHPFFMVFPWFPHDSPRPQHPGAVAELLEGQIFLLVLQDRPSRDEERLVSSVEISTAPWPGG